MPVTALCLNDITKGQTVRIERISCPDVETQALRLGISAGDVVQCLAKVPSGPVVIRHGGMELAIGKPLGVHIFVSRV